MTSVAPASNNRRITTPHYNTTASPRIYVLPARDRDVALVIRRGPSRWWHLLQWDLEKLELQPGAWLHGNLYPRRCALSPDGRLFGYFALKSTSEKSWPEAYFAVSRAPWLKALVAWETVGTWTGGCHFPTSKSLEVDAALHREPFHGRFPYRLALRGLDTDWVRRDIANELNRGWRRWDLESREVEHSLPLNDPPTAVLSRETGGATDAELILAHCGVDFRKPAIEGVKVRYFLRESGRLRPTPLRGVQWADWDRKGRLLCALRSGMLQVLKPAIGRTDLLWEQSLQELTPDPQPAPGEALHW